MRLLAGDLDGAKTMTCLISDDKKLVVCGGFRGQQYHYFTKSYRHVVFANSLWYSPNLVSNLKRKKHERIDLFKKRVKKKLGFMPQAFVTYRRKVLRPMMDQEMKLEKEMKVSG